MRALVTAFFLVLVVTGAQAQQLTTVPAQSGLSAADPAPSLRR
jgi:hypothetical protein